MTDTYTFEQLMSGKDIPEENVRKAAAVRTGKRDPGPVPRDWQERLRADALSKFKELYGKDADTIVAAEKGSQFVCMAYRVCP